MLSVWEAIQLRRSIRKYTSDDVPDELIEQMLEAAKLAPSGGNSQPWRFIVVRDAKIKKEICQFVRGQRAIEEAPVAIICFADMTRNSPEAMKVRWRELVESGIAPELSGRAAEPEFYERQAAIPRTREQLVMSAVSNTFIAIEHLLLMAAALELGTCWLGATDDARRNQLFGLPNNFVSVAVVTVGYPAGRLPPQRPRISIEKMLLKPLPRRTGSGASA